MPRDFAKQAGTKSIKQKPALKRKNNSRPETRRLRDFLGKLFWNFLVGSWLYFFKTTATEDLIEFAAQKGTSVPEIFTRMIVSISTKTEIKQDRGGQQPLQHAQGKHSSLRHTEFKLPRCQREKQINSELSSTRWSGGNH